MKQAAVNTYVVGKKGEEVVGGDITFDTGALAMSHILVTILDAICHGAEIKFTDPNPKSVTHGCKVSLQYKEIDPSTPIRQGAGCSKSDRSFQRFMSWKDIKP
jgi:hypothetical protein